MAAPDKFLAPPLICALYMDVELFTFKSGYKLYYNAMLNER